MQTTEHSSARSLAARANGRKGGLATSKNHTAEWLSERGRNAGSTTRDLYSSDFFRYAQEQRKIRRGWPKGKLRKSSDKAMQVVQTSGLTDSAEAALNNMLAHE
jgi:hypothetical protein